MRVFVCALLAFLYATVVEGEPCKFNLPVKSSVLKCGDQIYHRSPEAIAAHNECAQGKNGMPIGINHVDCVHEKLGYIKNGALDGAVIAAAAKQIFAGHYEAILKGILACTYANQKDPIKHYACHVQVYGDVCQHKSCDWFNSID